MQLEDRAGWVPGTSQRVHGRYALCFTCLAGWFPDRPDAWVADWLVRQVELGVKMAARKKPQERQGEFAWR